MAEDLTKIINLSDGLTSPPSIKDYRDRVTATAVALFFAYVVNFVTQGYVTFVKTDEGKAYAQKKLLETSQIMYWFGIATFFSVFPPFYYGAFNAVISYLTLAFVIFMHVFCFSDKRIKGRSLWSIAYFFYYLILTIWVLIGLILAYTWTNRTYSLT